MKTYLVIEFLLTLSIGLHAQNTNVENTDSSLINSLSEFGLNIEHYNLCDTAKNEFASYLIKTGFKSLKVRMEELEELPLTVNYKREQNIFRILSLPSFNHPICFTISNKNDQKYLSWTIGKGSGGYESKGIKKKGRTKISRNDWEYFKQLIDINSIDTLPLASYLPMTDGTSWIIEKNVDDNYKIYFSNILSTKLENGFALLLHISGVRTRETIHFYNNDAIRFFDSNNTLIDLNQIQDNIVKNLNKDFNDKLSNKNFGFDCGIYVKINSSEKLKSVKYIPYMLPHRSLADRFEYYQENYLDRRFRHQVKRSLQKIDFTELNLSKTIWIPVYIKYSTQKEILEIDKNYQPLKE